MPPAQSAMLPLGTPCPEFDLPDHGINGSNGAVRVRSADLVGSPAVVIMVVCNHCPFVKHVDEALVGLAAELEPEGVRFIGVSSNSAETHPADAPDRMTAEARKVGYPFRISTTSRRGSPGRSPPRARPITLCSIAP